MKKSDIAMIILIAALSIGAAFLVIGSIPGLNISSTSSEKVKTIDRFESNIADPDTDVFNSTALNPTVDITIGESDASEDSN